MFIIEVMDVNTGEILFTGTWEEVRVFISKYKYVDKKYLWTNYGFTDDTENRIYVVVE